MIRYLDFNDSWHAGHPSDIIGGLLAVAAVSTDGSRVEIETGDPRGDSTNPMGDREIDAKFSLLAEPVLGSAGSTRALEVWRDIDAASALSGSMATLVC